MGWVMIKGGGRVIFRKDWHVCIEVLEQELRWLWYLPKGKNGVLPSSLAFHTISLPPGVIEQGQIRQPEKLTHLLKETITLQMPNLKKNTPISLKLALPGNSLFIREYLLPWTKKKERKGLLKYLAEEEIPIPTEELLYEHSLVEDKENHKLKVLLAGIRKTYLYSLVEVFQGAGFIVKEVGVSLLAWKRALLLTEEEETIIVLEEGDQVHLVVYKRGAPQLIRGFEIQRILFYLEPLARESDVGRILMGTGSRAKETGMAIQDILSRHQVKKPLLQELGKVLEDISPTINSAWQNAFGQYQVEQVLTCMGLLGKTPCGIDFWEHHQAYRKIRTRKQVVAGLLLITMMGTGFTLFQILQRSDILQEEIATLRELEADQRVLQDNIMRPVYTWQNAENKKTIVGQELRALLALRDESIQLKRIEIKGNTLLIEGGTAEAQVVPRMFERLKELAWLNIELTNYEFANYDLSNSEFANRSARLPIQFAIKAEKNGVGRP